MLAISAEEGVVGVSIYPYGKTKITNRTHTLTDILSGSNESIKVGYPYV